MFVSLIVADVPDSLCLLSKSNEHEVGLLTKMAQYLVSQGYEEKQITVLAAYVGQLLLLRKVRRSVS